MKEVRKLREFWYRVFHGNRGKVEIGCDRCPVCRGKIQAPIMAGLDHVCPHCRAELTSIVGKLL